MGKGEYVLKVIGFAVLVASYICFIYVFTMAYVSPAKMTRVYVNRYNEGDLEWFLMWISAPLVLWLFKEMWSKIIWNSRKTSQ